MNMNTRAYIPTLVWQWPLSNTLYSKDWLNGLALGLYWYSKSLASKVKKVVCLDFAINAITTTTVSMKTINTKCFKHFLISCCIQLMRWYPKCMNILLFFSKMENKCLDLHSNPSAKCNNSKQKIREKNVLINTR